MASDRRKRRNRRKQRLRRPQPMPLRYVVPLRLPRVEITPDRRWYVVRTLAQMDNRVLEGLRGLGAETYLPVLVEERIRRGRRIEWPQKPLAGYVFVGVADNPMRCVQCEGVLEILTADGAPVAVPVEALQEFADHVTGCNEERREAMQARRTKIKLRGLETLKQISYSTF